MNIQTPKIRTKVQLPAQKPIARETPVDSPNFPSDSFSSSSDGELGFYATMAAGVLGAGASGALAAKIGPLGGVPLAALGMGAVGLGGAMLATRDIGDGSDALLVGASLVVGGVYSGLAGSVGGSVASAFGASTLTSALVGAAAAAIPATAFFALP